MESFENASHPGKAVRILLLEDNIKDAEIIQNLLESSGLNHNVFWVRDGKAYETALDQEPFNLLLCDYSLPGYSGVEAIEATRRKESDVPVIVNSGSITEEIAIQLFNKGITDYVLKHRMDRLVPAVKRALT